MKNFLLFISFLFAFLFCTRAVNGDSLSEEKGTVESVLLTNDLPDYCQESPGLISPVTSEDERATAFEDAHSMARQLRLVHRNQRTLVLHHILLDKSQLSKACRFYIEALYSSNNHLFTTLPYLSWEVSSEHYIFGMRRILI